MWFPFFFDKHIKQKENIFINNVLYWGVQIFHNWHVTCQKRNIWLLCKYKTCNILYHHAHPLHTFWLYFIVSMTERTYDYNNMRSYKKVRLRDRNSMKNTFEVYIFQWNVNHIHVVVTSPLLYCLRHVSLKHSFNVNFVFIL